MEKTLSQPTKQYEIFDHKGRRIKRGGAFQYINNEGETKAFVFEYANPHPSNISGLWTVRCHYADDPTKHVYRSMYAARITYMTRGQKLFKQFKARFLRKK